MKQQEFQLTCSCSFEINVLRLFFYITADISVAMFMKVFAYGCLLPNNSVLILLYNITVLRDWNNFSTNFMNEPYLEDTNYMNALKELLQVNNTIPSHVQIMLSY